MKISNCLLQICIVTFNIGVASAASTVTYGFGSSSSGDLFEGGGVSGWGQDSTNPSAFGQTFPLAYVSATDFGTGSSNAAYLGTQLANTADNSSTTLTGNFSTLQPSGRVTMSFDMAILDNPADSFEGRDNFETSLKSSTGAEIATIGFSPTTGDNDSWDVSIGVNGTTSTVPGVQILANSGYRFVVSADLEQTSFYYGAAGPLGGDILIGSTNAITSLNSSAFVSFTHDPLATAGTSANTLTFDNVMVQIPEPSSSLLMILSAGFMAVRRRR
ncbi:PEP-CTERM sorting domain-containing protein [Akkermansiaceae bacterium]|nr:PEP-CTERM sorting domain-containing protein [Akkermansiaceae bacterium]